MNNYILKCKDLGFADCDFTATGNSESEVKRKFYYHSTFIHEEELRKMTDEDRIKLHEMMKDAINIQNLYLLRS